ncbi:hypothetical protein H0H87_011096 [Tephrocybe sp. NHM501043]|nr:hypothetical protein H0H87_011096 [Tephrocybe sp. NHM501043]
MQQVDVTGILSIDILQSQLFVLKVLSMTMASRWTQSRSDSRSSHNNPGTPDSNSLPGASIRSHDHQDPVPLDENCARYVLSVIIMLLRLHSLHDNSLVLPGRFSDLTFRDFESHSVDHNSDTTTPPSEPTTVNAHPHPHPHTRTRQTEPPLRAQSSSNSVRSGQLSLNSTIQIPATKVTYEKTHMTLVKSAIPVSDLIRQYLSRIVFQISASNWNVVYSKIRSKIQFLASNTTEHPDITDLQLMAHCALDRQRLVQILSGLSLLPAPGVGTNS